MHHSFRLFLFIWCLSQCVISQDYWYSTTDWGSSTTTPFIGCVRPQRKTTVYGNAFATFRNTDIRQCCEFCQKIPDCVLSSWVAPSFSSQVAICNLFNNVTSIVYDPNSMTESLFPKNISFKCKNAEDRYFYELDWIEIDNVNKMETCIEICTFDSTCKSWMFVNDTSSCLTSTMNYDGTKWTTYSGAITGTCSLNL